jgi:hypothetical protein
MGGRLEVKVCERVRAVISRRRLVGLYDKGVFLSVLLVIMAGFGLGILGGAGRVHADTAPALDPGELKDLLPLEEIIAKAKAEHDGQLIEAELKEHGGVDVYETEILDGDGKVWEMRFNAKTGELMQQSEGTEKGVDKDDETPGD